MRYWLPLLAGILICFSSCRNPAPEEWTDLVPEKTPFLVLPENGQSLRELLNAPYMPLLEDVTPAAIQLTGDLLEVPSQSLPVTAMLLYPDTSNDLQPVFIGDLNDGFARALIQAFQEPYTQRNYQFGDETIQILRISERQFYLLEYGPYAILSESSLAIEDMIRTWRGDMTAIRLDPDQLQRGSYILNTPSLDRWVEQLADIGYRPALRGLFQGTSPVTLRPGDSEQPEHLSWMLEGHIGLENEKSALIHAVSGTARSFLLDRYIPSNASGFSIFFLESRSLPTADPVSDLDRQLSDDRDLFKEISSTLHPELAFAAFTETGFMSTSEYVILRRLENPQRLRTLLAGLADVGLIQ